VAHIAIPTRSLDDWELLLARPSHWKAGYSAMTLAQAWEDAAADGFPPEVRATINTAEREDWTNLRLLLAIPGYKVPLPGGSRPSQTDLAALARGDRGLVAVAIEGKVDETLGPTVGEKRTEKSSGVDERLAFLQTALDLSSVPDNIRYQLLHRTVSALRIADDFAAESAIMLVHSFSPTHQWYDDFMAFGRPFDAAPERGSLAMIGKKGGIPLYIGWCGGDQRFRAEIAPRLA